MIKIYAIQNKNTLKYFHTKTKESKKPRFFSQENHVTQCISKNALSPDIYEILTFKVVFDRRQKF